MGGRNITSSAQNPSHRLRQTQSLSPFTSKIDPGSETVYLKQRETIYCLREQIADLRVKIRALQGGIMENDVFIARLKSGTNVQNAKKDDEKKDDEKKDDEKKDDEKKEVQKKESEKKEDEKQRLC